MRESSNDLGHYNKNAEVGESQNSTVCTTKEHYIQQIVSCGKGVGLKLETFKHLIVEDYYSILL